MSAPARDGRHVARAAGSETPVSNGNQIKPQSKLIVLVHPSRLFRDCLTQSLREVAGFEIRDFPEAEEATEALQGARDALLLLFVPADASAVNSIDALFQRIGHEVPVVVTGDSEDPRVVAALLAKGVSGYIPTSLKLEVTIGALSLIAAGGVYAPADCLVELWRSAANGKDNSATTDGLTSKQLAVVDAIRKGKANKTIAYELNMCESTVKVHIRNIMKKLQAKNRTQVAYIATKLLAERPGSAP